MEYNEARIHRKGRRKPYLGRKNPSLEKIFEIFNSLTYKRITAENGWSAILVSVIF